MLLRHEFRRRDGCGSLGQIVKERWNLSSVLRSPIRMTDSVSQLLHEKQSERFPALPGISGKHHNPTPAVVEPGRGCQAVFIFCDDQNPFCTRCAVQVPEQPVRTIDRSEARLKFEKLIGRSLRSVEDELAAGVSKERLQIQPFRTTIPLPHSVIRASKKQLGEGTSPPPNPLASMH